ncbi:MAG: UDP-N-acetylmuramoyl-tripeptide--D-alanyl-D-alanine ligase [Candidatus Marivariicella sp.]
MNYIKEIYDIFKKSSGVYTDSRNPLKNGLFFALSGEKYNGNDYAAESLHKGAISAVVDNEELASKSNKFIYVKNSLETLQRLASFHRQKFKCPVLAITGSNGKTTTKELLKIVLSKKHNTHATIGNLNNHIGVPITILNTPISSDFLIIEMGANHLNEIKNLCKIAKPTHGFITNFGLAHLEGFGGKEGVIKGKSELYDFLDSSNGEIFVNHDNQNQINKLGNKKYISFGQEEKADFNLVYNLSNKNNLEISFKGSKFITNLYGEYNLPNVSAAIVIGDFFNVSLKNIKEAIESYRPLDNRSQVIKINNKKIILDAYNANPSSMEFAIKNFHKKFTNDRILIIGDMLELGEYSKSAHKQIVNLIIDLSFDKVITVGENFFEISNTPNYFKKYHSTDELIKFISLKVVKEKNILIKGSRSLRLEKILKVL